MTTFGLAPCIVIKLGHVIDQVWVSWVMHVE